MAQKRRFSQGATFRKRLITPALVLRMLGREVLALCAQFYIGYYYLIEERDDGGSSSYRAAAGGSRNGTVSMDGDGAGAAAAAGGESAGLLLSICSTSILNLSCIGLVVLLVLMLVIGMAAGYGVIQCRIAQRNGRLIADMELEEIERSSVFNWFNIFPSKWVRQQADTVHVSADSAPEQ
jgi:hypothetical protein